MNERKSVIGICNSQFDDYFISTQNTLKIYVNVGVEDNIHRRIIKQKEYEKDKENKAKQIEIERNQKIETRFAKSNNLKMVDQKEKDKKFLDNVYTMYVTTQKRIHDSQVSRLNSTKQNTQNTSIKKTYK